MFKLDNTFSFLKKLFHIIEACLIDLHYFLVKHFPSRCRKPYSFFLRIKPIAREQIDTGVFDPVAFLPL